jgi:hypothetical protein
MNTATSSEAASLVKGPAISLIVLGALGAAMQGLGMLIKLLGMGGGDLSQLEEVLGPEAARWIAMLQSPVVAVVTTAVGLAAAALLIVGGLKMMKLESYALAMIAAVVAAIPCLSPCCCLGLPFTVWAVVVLLKDEVKAAFT